MKDIILRTNNLTKKYKDFTALNNANITINKGDIYGLIGRNGAGKTTLMKVITTLTNKTNGEFYLFDKDDSDLTETKRRIGCLIENPAFFENLTAYQNLKYYAIQKGIVDYSQIDKVLDLVKLSDSKNKKFKTFSLGMKQRLGIAFAMLDNPDFVILDEPINGLDPMGIVEIRELLKKINKEKDMTILISSHILSELSELATTYGIISNGKLIEEITAKQLSEKCRQYIDLKVDDTARAVILLERELGISDYEVLEDSNIKVFSNLDNVGEVNSLLSRSGIIVESISVKGENLEEYFMNKVGGVLNA